MKKNLNLLLHSDKDTNIYTSSCSTPFVSAPSSPGRTSALFYSAPASPIHFLLSANSILTPPPPYEDAGNEFDFDANCFPMTSADDLFFNGQILPMNHPEVSHDHRCGRSELRNMSLRRVRSEEQFQLDNDDNDNDKLDGKKKSDEVQGRPWLLRNSKRWVSLFLYRSKSEGRNNGRHKYFWSSFSPVVKDKKITEITNKNTQQQAVKEGKIKTKTKKKSAEQSQRLGLSAHYTANRAQSEEMRKKTYLPYRQGIFGCIGINPRPSASFNAFAARAFDSSVSS